MINASQILDRACELAKSRPDVRYEDTDCRYNAGFCSDGTIGCIFGQAARELGFKIDDLSDQSTSILDVMQSEKGIVFDLTNKQQVFASLLQEGQDEGMHWCDALRFAKKELIR